MDDKISFSRIHQRRCVGISLYCKGMQYAEGSYGDGVSVILKCVIAYWVKMKAACEGNKILRVKAFKPPRHGTSVTPNMRAVNDRT